MTHQQRFGSAVRALRTQHGLTQADLAAKIGVKPAFVGHIENGVRGVDRDPDLVARLEDALRVKRGTLAKHLPANHPARKIAGSGADLKLPLIGAVSAGSFEPLRVGDPGEEMDLRAQFGDGSKVGVVSGHSCSRFGIFDGDTVLLRDAKTPEDGQFCVVETGEGMTLKWHWQGQLYRWLPHAAEPEVVPFTEDTKLLGVVVLRIGKLNWTWSRVASVMTLPPPPAGAGGAKRRR